MKNLACKRKLIIAAVYQCIFLFLQNDLTTLSGTHTLIADVYGDQLCEMDSCNPNPCKNSGVCTLDDEFVGGYKCSCRQGYQGTNCEEDSNECLDGKCVWYLTKEIDIVLKLHDTTLLCRYSYHYSCTLC